MDLADKAKKQESNVQVPNDAYWNLFQNDPIGKQIFEEMCAYHYDIESFVRDNQYETSFNEGRRSVIRWLMQKMMMAQLPDNNNKNEDNSQ